MAEKEDYYKNNCRDARLEKSSSKKSEIPYAHTINVDMSELFEQLQGLFFM